MKKKVFCFLIIFMSFLYVKNVAAETYTSRVKIIHDKTNLRPVPGTQEKKIDTLDIYDYYVMVSDKLYDDTNNHKGCEGGWYNITYYTGVTGYVCSDDVVVVTSYSNDDATPVSDCEKKISEAGFPSSYWGGLCKLKEENPTWEFQPINVDLDWEYVVDRESECGRNYIYKGTYDKTFLDTTCKKTSPGGYVAPSQTAIAYYMDPRNFFTEKYFFQFLDQGYDERLEVLYKPTVESIIKGAMFYTYHKEKGNDIPEYITSGSKDVGASPIFIATRIYQEMGTKDSLINLWSGTYNGVFDPANEKEGFYLDYYNFYNFGVSDSCVAESGTTACGLKYAQKSGWKGLEKAIRGGASQIANGYIKQGQYTGYLQKYNVVPKNTDHRFGHQYMTNVAAAISESKTSYNAYKKSNLLGETLVFKIPVYNKMNATISNSANGAVDDPNSGKDPSTMPIHTIVTSSGYKYSKDYISGIDAGTDVASLKGAIESVGGNSTVVITDSKGTAVTTGKIGTGFKIAISNKDSKEVLEAVVKGDTSGDGEINALDLLQVQKNILGTYNLSEAQKQAGDTSSDGAINALDLLQVQKSILGTYKIEQ